MSNSEILSLFYIYVVSSLNPFHQQLKFKLSNIAFSVTVELIVGAANVLSEAPSNLKEYSCAIRINILPLELLHEWICFCSSYMQAYEGHL